MKQPDKQQVGAPATELVDEDQLDSNAARAEGRDVQVPESPLDPRERSEQIIGCILWLFYVADFEQFQMLQRHIKPKLNKSMTGGDLRLRLRTDIHKKQRREG
jgi:hypothetical protein